MDRFIPLVLMIGWFAMVFLGSYLVNWLLVRSIIRKFYRWFVAPGVIVHELSHALGCLITGSQITDINFWKSTGGHVEHRISNNPIARVVADPIIALAPIGGTFLLLIFLTWFLVPQLAQQLMHPSYLSLTDSIDFAAWQTWLYLYLITSLMATVAPSKVDIMYALGSLVVLFILLVLTSFVPVLNELILSIQLQLEPFALFSLGLIAMAVVISFLLAIPTRNLHFVPREQIE